MVAWMEKQQARVEELREENRMLKERLNTTNEELKELRAQVVRVKEEHREEPGGLNLETKKAIEEEVVRLLRQKKGRVATTWDKDRYILLYGDKETEQKDWKLRAGNQKKKIESILRVVEGKDRYWETNGD